MNRLGGIRPGWASRGILPRLLLSMSLAMPLAAQAHPDILLQIEKLDQRIALAPGAPDLYIKRGELHRRHGDLEQGADDLATARRLSPGHPLLDWYEGRLLTDAKEFARAESLLTRYLEAHPEHAAAWHQRADARLGLGRFHAAAADFSRAIRIGDRPGPGLFRSWVLALVRADEGNIETIRIAIGRGLARFPREVSLLGLAVDLALWHGRTGTAGTQLAELPDPLLDLPQWRFRAGVISCLDGNFSAAKSQFSSLLRAKGALGAGRTGTWAPPPDRVLRQLADQPRPEACVAAVRMLVLALDP